MQYELFYLVGERQEANLDAIKKGVNDIMVSAQATLLDPEQSEKRKLAYEIKHQNKGTYVTRRFELPDADQQDESPAKLGDEKEFGIEAITRKLNLNNDVLRFMIVKTEDLPDLGAKERRKAQEMNAAKQSPQRPPRPGERPKAPGIQARRPQQPKPAVQPTKEEAKDIDKKLDELLNI